MMRGMRGHWVVFRACMRRPWASTSGQRHGARPWSRTSSRNSWDTPRAAASERRPPAVPVKIQAASSPSRVRISSSAISKTALSSSSAWTRAATCARTASSRWRRSTARAISSRRSVSGAGNRLSSRPAAPGILALTQECRQEELVAELAGNEEMRWLHERRASGRASSAAVGLRAFLRQPRACKTRIDAPRRGLGRGVTRLGHLTIRAEQAERYFPGTRDHHAGRVAPASRAPRRAPRSRRCRSGARSVASRGSLPGCRAMPRPDGFTEKTARVARRRPRLRRGP